MLYKLAYTPNIQYSTFHGFCEFMDLWSGNKDNALKLLSLLLRYSKDSLSDVAELHLAAEEIGELLQFAEEPETILDDISTIVKETLIDIYKYHIGKAFSIVDMLFEEGYNVVILDLDGDFGNMSHIKDFKVNARRNHWKKVSAHRCKCV